MGPSGNRSKLPIQPDPTDPGAERAIRIKYVPLFDLRHMGHPTNAKDHDLGAIMQSIRRFGFVAPVLVSADNRIVAGHGRVEALEAMKSAGHEVPARIRPLENDWAVPCVTGLTFDDAASERAYLIADNRLTDLGGWDQAALLNELAALYGEPGGLTGTGYDAEDLDALNGLVNAPRLAPTEAANDPNAVYEGMPEFINEDASGKYRITVHIETEEHLADLAARLGQKLTDRTRSIWHPYKPWIDGLSYTVADSDDES